MSARDLRLVFAGTPEFAAAHLACLLGAGIKPVSAYSQPDRPAGRGKKLEPTPVRTLAERHGIPVRQPAVLDAEARAGLAADRPDLMVVVAYGLLLPPAVLAIPRLGCINVHASLLPRWRGAAPIERALLAGDAESGISLMQMDAGLDTGPLLATATTPITGDDNAGMLTARLVQLGCRTLLATLDALAGGTARAVPQALDGVVYAPKLRKEETGIEWARAAASLHNQVRAFFPRSPAWFVHQGQRVRILESRPLPATSPVPGSVVQLTPDAMTVACGDGTLQISRIQLDGKNPMSLRELLNGRPDFFKPRDVLLPASAYVRQ